jgi:hypothetical protein
MYATNQSQMLVQLHASVCHLWFSWASWLTNSLTFASLDYSVAKITKAGQNYTCSQSYIWKRKEKRKDSAGSDDTASMIKGGGYLGARTRQTPTM